MRNRQTLFFITLAVALIAGPALAQNSIQVVQPGLNGTGNALEVTFDGTPGVGGNQAVVISQHPSNESVFSMSFYINTDTTSICTATDCRLFIARAFGNATGGFLDAFRIGLKRIAAGQFRVLGWYKDSTSPNPGTWEQLNGPFLNGGGTTDTKVTMEWQSETSPGAGDGFVRIFKNDDTGTAVETSTASNFNDVDNARIGHVTGAVRSGASGTARLDEYVSTRALAP